MATQVDADRDGDRRVLTRLRKRAAAGMEAALWLIAAACLLWVGWSWADARWFQWSESRRLESSSPDGATVLPGASEQRHVAVGSALGQLRIPRLGLDVVLAEGTSAGVLRRAVGHVEQSALPGSGGNVVLAGHRDTFLRPLKDIEVGDEIQLESGGETRRYSVVWTRVVEPHENEVVQPTDHPVLTLVTCYPFNFVGPAPHRFIVRARLQGRDLLQASG